VYPDLDDAENAVTVGAAVPRATDVVDELEIEAG